jgi:RimJ/RimL family protein N-acetyltransferase
MVSSLSDVHLRPYHLDDAQALYEAVRESLKELEPWMPWCHPAYSIDESRSWLQRQVRAFGDGTEFEFAITSPQGRYLGGCGLSQIDKAKQQANLGYWVRTSSTRRGVATRAVEVLRDWAFGHTGLIRLEIVVAVGNAASRRVAEKSGAVPEGISKNRLFLFGVSHDAAVFSFTKAV